MDKLKPCPFCGGEAVLTQLTAVYNSGRRSLTTDFYVNCTWHNSLRNFMEKGKII